MFSRKKKLTPAQRAAKKRRRKEYASGLKGRNIPAQGKRRGEAAKRRPGFSSSSSILP